ncbi:hypothetical protein N7488_003816 [Penicillium malachiteum]|nr:hypothetical protein N7488_003816 [Penicillium malachiteum]
MDPEDIQLQLGPEDLTLRCVIKANWIRDDSRASALVISWAQSRAERLSTEILQKVGTHPNTDLSIQLNMVIMYISAMTFFSMDVTRSFEIGYKRAIASSEKSIKISERKDAYVMSRNIQMDPYVAEEYKRLSADDKRPLPLFYDTVFPPFYDNGQHREDLQRLYHRGPLTDEEKEEMERRKREADAKKESLEN